MTRSVQVWRSVIVPMAVGAMTLMGPSMPSAVQADDEMKVEVTITDRGFDVKGHTTPGSLTRVVVKNQGTMTHGITSPMFKEGVTKKEGDGVEIPAEKGKGYRAYHLSRGRR